MSSTVSDVYVTPLSQPTQSRPVQRFDFQRALTGNWSMRLEMAGDATLEDGPVTIQLGASLLRGYVARAGDDRGQWIGIAVGGQAQTKSQGLDRVVTSQHYYQTPARTVLQATLSQVGETLATDSEGIDSQLEPGYARRAIACSRVLDEIADMLGLYWRVRLDGAVYFGRNPPAPWPASGALFAYESKQPDTASPLVMPLPQQVLVEPGQTVILDDSASASPPDKLPQKVVCVRYWGDQKTQQARFWFRDPNADFLVPDKLAIDPFASGLAALARESVRGVDWYRTFQGTVTTQRGDGTLDIELDRIFGVAEMPSIRGAAVSVPVGGASLSVRAGDRVSVIYENGDPRRARATVYETGSGNLAVARATDPVGQSAGFKTWASAITSAVNALAKTAIVPPVDPIGTITSGSPDLKLR